MEKNASDSKTYFLFETQLLSPYEWTFKVASKLNSKKKNKPRILNY